MTYYHRLGEIPPKRHTQFRQPDKSLYKEELVSSKGFAGIYSNLYHMYSPTSVEAIEQPERYDTKLLENYPLQHTHLKTANLSHTGTEFLSARKVLLKNADVSMAICCPSSAHMDYYYKNASADEILFVHEGEGHLYSQFGDLSIRKGDYVVIPRTTIYKLEWKKNVSPKLLIIESAQPIETVARYRNGLGQLLEHSPYCERDIRPPHALITEHSEGLYRVKIKKEGYLHSYLYKHSPFDLIGWGRLFVSLCFKYL